MRVRHIHISARHHLLDLKLREVWRYRGLIWLFTRRGFVVTYKQTILGPLWLLLIPLLTSATHMVLFGNIAKLSTDGTPQLLFYLTGNALWGYFSACVTRSSATFTGNASLFGKVYFPRLVMLLSDMLGSALRFCIQLALVLGLLAWYAAGGMVAPRFLGFFFIPVLLLQLGVMGLGLGVIISSLTTRYRDLSVLVGFGVQLWMYATPVVYPLSAVKGGLRRALLMNPVTAPMELFRRILLGVGTVSPGWLAYSAVFTAVIALLGVMIFNKVERTFMDTV